MLTRITGFSLSLLAHGSDNLLTDKLLPQFCFLCNFSGLWLASVSSDLCICPSETIVTKINPVISLLVFAVCVRVQMSTINNVE